MAINTHERKPCEFEGKRKGSAALNWGQYRVWNDMRPYPPGSSNMCRIVAPPDESTLTVSDASDLVSCLVARHEALRTQVLTSDDHPYQTVKRAGSLPLVILRCDEESIGEAREALLGELCTPPFDYSVEGSARFGLVVVDHRVRLVVFVLDRIVLDFYALQIVERELQLLLQGETLATEPAMHPLDLTADQESPRWREHSARALAYWTEERTRTVPAMFLPVASASDPPVQTLQLVSEVILLASELIARRNHVSTSTVLLAASAALVGSWTGSSTCVMTVAARNRFLPKYSEMVTSLSQRGLFVLDLAGRSTVNELIESTGDAALRTYRHAYYDQEAVDTMIAQISDDRGADMAPDLYFNDIRPDAARSAIGKNGSDATEPTAAVRALQGKSRLRYQGGMSWIRNPVNIKVVPHSGAIEMFLTSDTRYLPPDHMKRFMRDFENLVVQASLSSAGL